MEVRQLRPSAPASGSPFADARRLVPLAAGPGQDVIRCPAQGLEDAQGVAGLCSGSVRSIGAPLGSARFILGCRPAMLASRSAQRQVVAATLPKGGLAGRVSRWLAVPRGPVPALPKARASTDRNAGPPSLRASLSFWGWAGLPIRSLGLTPIRRRASAPGLRCPERAPGAWLRDWAPGFGLGDLGASQPPARGRVGMQQRPRRFLRDVLSFCWGFAPAAAALGTLIQCPSGIRSAGPSGDRARGAGIQPSPRPVALGRLSGGDPPGTGVEPAGPTDLRNEPGTPWQCAGPFESSCLAKCR